jgi:hypothetical protein
MARCRRLGSADKLSYVDIRRERTRLQRWDDKTVYESDDEVQKMRMQGWRADIMTARDLLKLGLAAVGPTYGRRHLFPRGVGGGGEGGGGGRYFLTRGILERNLYFLHRPRRDIT